MINHPPDVQIDISTDSPRRSMMVSELTPRTLGEELYDKAIQYFNLADRRDDPSDFFRFTGIAGNHATLWTIIPHGYKFHAACLFHVGEDGGRPFFTWLIPPATAVTTAVTFVRSMTHPEGGAEEPVPHYKKPTPELLAEVNELLAEIESSSCWEEST